MVAGAQGPRGGSLRHQESPPKATLKYKKYNGDADPTQQTKKAPSQHMAELAQPPRNVEGWRPRPRIIELLNIADFSHHVECKVPVDEPIFQPFPPEVTFHNYEPFQTYEATLYLRNNDNVSRRVKVLPMDSPYFSVRRAASGPGVVGASKEDSKVATGMEVAFTITFRPESRDDYSCDLIICTEREKFVVPVLAVGASAALDFPDCVDFQSVPAKVDTKQTVFVRNVGSKAAHFSLSAPPPFTVSPTAGHLAPGETLQCSVTFEPPSTGRYEGEMEIQYDSGRCVYASLVGVGHELDVGLSQGVVTMLSTFVTKTSQKTFKIINNSDTAVKYAVKQRPSAETDMALTAQRLGSLTVNTAHGHGATHGGAYGRTPRDEHSTGGEGDGGASSEDEDAILASAEAQLTRRLHKAQRDALLDAYLFGDRSFSVNPAEGTIWPRSEVEVVVTFSPDHAREYEVMAYVDVAGRAERLPVVFKGRGLGPAAVFSYDTLDVGDTWVNTLHQYEVELQNRGKIDVDYRLVPPGSAFGTRFTFEPPAGRLSGGQIEVVKVKLLSDLLGAFDETFQWQIKGSSEPLSLQFKGRVCAPSFEVDVEGLDFGVCSYGFRYTKEFHLTNTSEIPLRFSWRVPTDVEEPKEFQILPAKGTILPHGKVKINVEFVSRTVQRYRTELVMDITGVAEKQLCLPLIGEGAVPKLSLFSKTMDFGECSLRFPYKQEMRIVNESKLPAKFEVVPQDPSSVGLATFTVEPSSGGIPARGEQVVELTLVTHTLGRIQIPVKVKALGSKAAPLEFIVNAKCVGPQLNFGDDETGRTPGAIIAFDRVPVLKEHAQSLMINNCSAIPADFKLFIEAKDSVFSVEPRQAHLEPGECMTAHVMVKMDESMDFMDTLHILIQEGADISVPLTASGTGSAIVAEDFAKEVLDFGYQFVGRPFTKEVTVYNMGRKTVMLNWSSMRYEELKKEYAKANRGSGKKFDITAVPQEIQPVFNITPDKVQLGPKEAATFTVTGNALAAGEVREQIVCLGMFGNSNKAGKRIFEPVMRADVATPLLHFSDRLLHYRYVYRKGVPIETQTRPLTIRNISPLPLTFGLRPTPPFTVDRTSWTLDLEESGTVNVTFDPNFKDDLQSVQTRTKLQIVYSDNPQRDSVDLYGDIDFPNLAFETTNIDFGSVLLDTTRRVPVRVVNSSNVDVVYTWAWDKASVQEDVNSIASMSLRQGRPKPPPTQLFDVMPIRGVLRPGEAETMMFTFFAYPGMKASCTAMCQVEGGPTYTVNLSGESNNIKYAVEPQAMDFGVQLYDRTVEREMMLTNSGKVPFSYNFNTSRLSRPGIVEAIPASGTIAPLTKEIIKLRVCPGIPEKLVETLLVEVAHFEPVPVQITVEGTYAAVSLNLPRQRDDVFSTCLESARQKIIQAALSHVPVDEPENPDDAALSLAPSGPPKRASRRSMRPVGDGPQASGKSISGARSIAAGAKSIAAGAKSIAAGAKSMAPARAQSAHSNAGRTGAQLPAEKKVEVEAERLRLITLLLEREAERKRNTDRAAELAAALEAGAAAAGQPGPGDATKRADTVAGSPPASTVGGESRAPRRSMTGVTTGPALVRHSSMQTAAGSITGPKASGAVEEEGTKRAPRVAPIMPSLPALAVAHYVLDFGYVVKGLTRTRKFRLTNTSNQQVSFRFDKGLLETHGFKLDPEVVSRLPGAPEFASAEVSVTLQANKGAVQPGPLELVYPITIKGSPPVLLTMRAHVQVPDMTLSTETLDFGSCQTGQCKVFTVQLHNHKQVPCEYQVRKPAEVIKAKDWQFFSCDPPEGTLEPDQRVNLKVVFTPILNRDAPYNQSIPIRINLNPRGKELVATGRGLTPKVQFSPTFVDCGPILPFFDGQEPNEAKVVMSNPCSFPIEVVSLDFDTRYSADEEALRAMDGYSDAGILYLPPLKPGDALWEDVAQTAAHKKRMESAAAEAQAAADAGDPDGGAAAAAAAEDGVGSLEAVANTGVGGPNAPAVSPKVLCVVAGPHMSGTTMQAQMLGRRYDVPVLTLDELLLAAADLEPPPPEATPLSDAVPDAAGDASSPGEAESALGSPRTPGAAAPAGPPPFDMDISDLLFDNVLFDPDYENDPSYVAPHTTLAQDELYGLIVRGVRHVIAQAAEYGKGLVLDSLVSRYLPPPLVAKALLEGLGMEQVWPSAPPPPLDGDAKKKAPKKDEPPSTPLTQTLPALGWKGPYRVHFVELQPEPPLLAGRLRMAADIKAVESGMANAAARALAEAAGELPPPLPPPGSAGPGPLGSRLPTPLMSNSGDVGAVPLSEAAIAALTAATASEPPLPLVVPDGVGAADPNAPVPPDDPNAPPPPPPAPAVDEVAQRFLEEAGRALAEFAEGTSRALVHELAEPGPDNAVTYRTVPADGTPDKVHKAVVGLTFKMGVLASVLPGAPRDVEIVPPRYAMQIVPRPRPRPPRTPVQKFKVFTFVDLTKEGAPPPPPPPPPATPPPVTPPKGAAKKAKDEPPPPPPPPPPTRLLQPDTRWVIPAGGSVELLVQFASADVGKFTETLAFDVLGGERLNTLVLTGTCDYPHISADYRNVFYKKVKARPQTPLIRGQYIISKGVFEFGPLLHSKDATGYLEGAHPDNTARIRITNNGLFDNHVEFSLKSVEQKRAEEEAAAAAGKGGKPGAKKPEPKKPDPKKADPKAKGKGGPETPPPGLTLDNVFTLHPTSLDLKVDETQELCVYGFPVTDGLVEDVIVCRIKDNPTPVEFPISLIGAKPQVMVRLNDGTPPPPMPSGLPEPPTPPASSSKPGTPAGPAAAPPGPPNKLLTEGIVFERLLVNKKDVKTFTITNPGLLPIKWRLANTASLPKEFVVYPQAGELAARSDIIVTVEFSALEKRVCDAKLALEVLDVQELQGVAYSIPLPIKGEAYKIEIDINFPQINFPGVDYGTLRVVDDVSKPITIKNTGKYAIAYNFSMKPNSVLAGLLTITPQSGNIDPNKDAKIEVAWNKDKSLRTEMTLVGNSDVTLSIIEPLTTNKEDTIPIQISARAVFSKYAVTPARGIHFGPTTYNTASKPKVVEITNLGQFEYRFRLFNYANGPPPPITEPGVDKKGKPAAPPKGKQAAVTALTIGQFTFDPPEGSIPPGGRREVAVVFHAVGSVPYSEVLGIDITERDFSDQPDGIPIEVAGESCIPGIDAENTAAIFEEHVISASLDPFNPVNNEFATRERVFNFGAVLAALGAPSEAEQAAAKKDGAATPPRGATPPKGAAVKAKEEPTSGASLAPHAVRANLKFINPVKVPCVVNFSIKPRGNLPPGTVLPMEVSPAQLVIPPLEYRYTAIYFAPRAIQTYVATLEAVVENGGDPKTKSFSCEVRGEGTLPTLTISEPTLIDAQGRPTLKFPRVLRGRSNTARITLKNNGILPAKARIEMPPHASYSLESSVGGEAGAETFTVESKRSVSYAVKFTPDTVGPVQHELKLRVANNPFEDYRFLLTGEGYQEDVTFEGLPHDSLDELRLQDGPVGRPVQAVFALQNHSTTKNFRFKWPAAGAPGSSPHLAFSPAIGHLRAGGSKDVTLTFSSDKPVKLSPQDVKLAIMAISYADEAQALDWDDRSVVVDYGLPPGPDGQPACVPEPEPKATDVAGSGRELVLHVHATADNAKYTCESGPIMFKPTMMFQTRGYNFVLANTSSARMDYKFTVMLADGNTADGSGLYTVTPAGGVIDAGQSQQITVKFSPTEVEDCSRVLTCHIPHLDASCEPLVRPLGGRVLRPWAHFELPDSDYLSGGRRTPDMPGPSGAIEPLDPATRVLEVESLGIKVRNTKRFFVLNPTGIAYEFFWQPMGRFALEPGPFACVTKRGVIGGGRQFEMVFEYTPTSDAIVESFWMFRIPEQNIEVPFLLVGLVSEPRVMLDRPSVNFGQILIGCKGHATITLMNNEHLPFQFAFDKNSYDATDDLIKATGLRPVVELEPSSGSVPPHSSVQVSATFTPRLERDVNYNVLCVVKNKPTRLTLNIKGEGTAIHEALQLENPDGTTVALAPRQANSLDFGQVLVNERCVRALALVNSGQVNFNFVWDVGTNPRISIHPEGGTVPRGERLMCELAYNPHGPDRLRDYKVTCQVMNGPKYTLLLNGVGHKPRLDLSWFNHDFGVQPVWIPGMAPAIKPLRLRNDDTQPIAVDPHWDASAPGSLDWEVDCGPLVLQPGESREWMVTYKPRGAAPAKLSLPLEINGLYTVHVEAKGEGSPLRVEVANPALRTVNFGPVAAGNSTTRVVAVINRGRVTATLSLAPSVEMLSRCCVDVIPSANAEVLLRPRESADLTFFFRPTGRMRPFTEELLVNLCGVPTPLATLTGACLGTELRLASESLPFGPVVLGSRAVKRLQLSNTGDVGSKFVWDTKPLAGQFTIFPADGFLAPGQDVKLDVTFHPSAVNPDVRIDKVRLKVEGGPDQTLTLTGACIATAAQPEVVTLSCNVRASTSQAITISNPSSSAWSLRPVVQNDFFSGPESLAVAPNSKASYPITFRPLTMSTPDQPHEGSVFFPIPDGTGLLYRLVGRAEAPVPEGKVEAAITAKAQHTEVLKCHNWLHKPQRFRILVERKSGDKSTQLTAPEYVDVPALSAKDIKLGVYSYTASTTNATVTFKNETSGEYLYYECKFVASAPSTRGTVALECPVRTQTSARVSVQNPLAEDVTVKASASNKQVLVPATTVIKGGATAEVEVRYRPLVVGSSEATLKLECPELGVFEWGLRLAGTPTNLERALVFNVPLGGRETQIFRFTHWLDEKADYKVSFKSSGTNTATGSTFTTAATVSAPPAVAGLAAGAEVSLEVAFEPTAIGENIRDTLVVASSTGGEYQCPLVGRCIPPKPQGPVDVSKGSAALPFANVFAADAEFQLAVDNPAFLVKPSERIGAKKSANIGIQFKPANPGAPRTGKLTISCPAQTQSQWVYYLQA
ncbi:hypothetical protein HYH03_012133 [Edaphochlamys debaryana]|uniref:Uncharacterized protein n=1 Tax=Edaphochlamys debaryana TaxID=47281 RepID=A0A835XSJ4_9CHLO|nr:hypothetical protein HYH03_012133 [Edaphochlamys debaryana]|eukprot:KAG2489301.1 hypothetical protein HYH03_012133 [Edaphochlamys debaryana]